jgi:spore cortex biosynthesis protein YabQ
MTLHDQLRLFAAMAVVGMLFGVLYDGYREWLLRNRRGKVARAIVDIAMWVLGGWIAISALRWQAYGVVRLAMFPALALGLWLYFRLFTRFMRRIWRPVLQIGTALLRPFMLKWLRKSLRRKRKTGVEVTTSHDSDD